MTGSLRIVGLGPGDPALRTRAAERAIREADVVAGYGPYLDQCADLLDGQEVLRGRMGEEEARAREAVARAAAGARVALVSSGDAGVHGMAARTLAAASGVAVEVIPGVTAALAVAARIGAPLADDWATLSLSDRQVPWEVVARRLGALAASGVALALYNPRSRTRPLERALDVLREHRAPDTPLIVATDVFRPGESIAATTLGAVDPASVTMRSLLLVAGDTARWAGPWLVAERGGGAEAAA
jgi:precorrin-3B C17-methyltransferase